MCGVKKDCFAYKQTASGSGRCTALIELFCKNEKCGFYKTKEQFIKEKLKSEQY